MKRFKDENILFSWVANRVQMIASDALISHIRDVFSAYDKKLTMCKRRRGFGNSPVRSYAVSPTGRFRHGLMLDVVAEIKKSVENPSFSIDSKFKENYPSKMEDEFKIGTPKLKLTPRDYQQEAIDMAFKHGCGVMLYPTGSGKTLIMAGIIKNMLDSDENCKVMVVTLTHLVTQTVSSFVDYGMNEQGVSAWTGTHAFIPSRVVICGPQILNSAMRNPDKYREEIAFLRKVSGFFVDEVHQCKIGNSISDFDKFVETRHRFGFTGTLPSDKLDEWNVIGLFGPVVQTVSRNELVGNGSITDVLVVDCKLEYKDRPRYLIGNGMKNGINNFRSEQDFLYNSSFRNGFISRSAMNTKKNCLVLVDRISLGENLEKMMKDIGGKEVFFIQGSVDSEVRDRIKSIMEDNNDVVCIAMSSIFSTGINVTNLFYIIFANCCKAKVSVIQSIGRGVRIKEGKSKVIVFDVHDDLRYGNRLFSERVKLYNSQGFKMQSVVKSEAYDLLV